MTSNNYIYREPGQAPILVRQTKSERESIITYAREHGLSVSQARRQLVTAELARQEQEALQSGKASVVIPGAKFEHFLNLANSSGITVNTLVQNALRTALQNKKDESPTIQESTPATSIARGSFDMGARYYRGGAAFYPQAQSTVHLAQEPVTDYPAIIAESLQPTFRRPEPAPQMYDLHDSVSASNNSMQQELRNLIELHKATEAKNQQQIEALSAKTDTVLQAAMLAADKSTEAAKGSGFSLIKVSFLSELFSGKFSIGGGKDKDKDVTKSNEPKVGTLKKLGNSIKDGTVTGLGMSLKGLAVAASMAGILAGTAQIGNYVTPAIPTASQIVSTVNQAAHLEISAKKGVDVSFTMAQPADLLQLKAASLVRVHGADKDPLKMEELKKSLGDEVTKSALDGSTNDFNNKVALLDAVKAVEAKQLSNTVTNAATHTASTTTPAHP